CRRSLRRSCPAARRLGRSWFCRLPAILRSRCHLRRAIEARPAPPPPVCFSRSSCDLQTPSGDTISFGGGPPPPHVEPQNPQAPSLSGPLRKRGSTEPHSKRPVLAPGAPVAAARSA